MDIFELHKFTLSTARYTDWIYNFIEDLNAKFGKNITYFHFNDQNLYIDIKVENISSVDFIQSVIGSYTGVISKLISKGLKSNLFTNSDKGTALFAHQIINTNNVAFHKMCERTITIMNFSNPLDTCQSFRINFHN